MGKPKTKEKTSKQFRNNVKKIMTFFAICCLAVIKICFNIYCARVNAYSAIFKSISYLRFEFFVWGRLLSSVFAVYLNNNNKKNVLRMLSTFRDEKKYKTWSHQLKKKKKNACFWSFFSTISLFTYNSCNSKNIIR